MADCVDALEEGHQATSSDRTADEIAVELGL